MILADPDVRYPISAHGSPAFLQISVTETGRNDKPIKEIKILKAEVIE